MLAAALTVCGALPVYAETRYVFATFLGDDAAKEKLSIYTSSDGTSFKLLSDTGYAGPTGVLRDPSIMKHSDGKYYIAYTVQSWTTNSTSFAIASSTDLTHWTFLTEVPSGIAKTRFTWAPEWFRDDDGTHLIVNLETTAEDGFRSYDFKAKSDALTEWEAPVLLGIGPNNIDTFIVKSDAKYHAFSKNESTKYIEHATSSALHGPWNWVGKGDFAGWGSGKEGISLFQMNNGGWRMFLDCYSGCGFLYADSKNLDDWSATTKVSTLSGTRHGTVLREELSTTSPNPDADAGAPSAAAPIQMPVATSAPKPIATSSARPLASSAPTAPISNASPSSAPPAMNTAAATQSPSPTSPGPSSPPSPGSVSPAPTSAVGANPKTGSGDSSCSCSVPGTRHAGGLKLPALIALALLRRRRKFGSPLQRI